MKCLFDDPNCDGFCVRTLHEVHRERRLDMEKVRAEGHTSPCCDAPVFHGRDGNGVRGLFCQACRSRVKEWTPTLPSRRPRDPKFADLDSASQEEIIAEYGEKYVRDTPNCGWSKK